MAQSIVDLAKDLLEQLKQPTRCNDELKDKVKQTVLAPFQVDVSQPKPPPSPQEFRILATKLGPLALRIAKQSIKSVDKLSKTETNIDTEKAANCLLDCVQICLTALHHMKGGHPLEPYELEKITASLITRMVDRKAHTRALELMDSFRSTLAATVKVILNSPNSGRQVHSPPSSLQGAAKETFDRYQNLFSFPRGSDDRDHTTILLVLSYQMNALRCWFSMYNGALKKSLADVLDKPGNYYDWCKYLHRIKPVEAKGYLDWAQRILNQTADNLPLSSDTVLAVYNIRVLAAKMAALSDTNDRKSTLERMVALGVQYEKACEKIGQRPNYVHLRKYYLDYLNELQPNLNDIPEMNFYFVLCDYAAYTAKKSNNYDGVLSSYKQMLKTIQPALKSKSANIFYYTAYAANANIAFGSAHVDKMLADNMLDRLTISNILQDSESHLKYLYKLLPSETASYDHHTENALYYLCQAIDVFQRSCKHLLKIDANRKATTERPQNYDDLREILLRVKQTLDHVHPILIAGINLAKSKETPRNRAVTISRSFVEIMVILSHIQIKCTNRDILEPAKDYLREAEKICSSTPFRECLNYLAVAYYNEGRTLIQAKEHNQATRSLIRSIELLKKDVRRASSTEIRSQLCKRYELYGGCCQVGNKLEDASKAYRLAMNHVPAAVLKSFTSKHKTMSIATRMTEEILVPSLLEKYIAVTVIQDGEVASERFSISELSALEQCYLLECELRVCERLPARLDGHQLKIVKKLLEAYERDTHPIRRARVLLQKIFIERRYTQNRMEKTQETLKLATEAKGLLERSESSPGGDAELLKYRSFYIGLAYFWIVVGMADSRKRIMPDKINAILQSWIDLLRGVTTILDSRTNTPDALQEVYGKIDDIDQFHFYLRLLSDLLGLHGQYVHQIAVLKLQLKLSNGLRTINKLTRSDSIVIAADIAKLYVELGYTGKAEELFAKIDNVIEENTCTTAAKVHYYLNYAQYCITMHHDEKSIEAYKAAEISWESQYIEDSEALVKTTRALVLEKLLLANVYYTISMFHSTFDKLDVAIEAAGTSLRLLFASMKALEEQPDSSTMETDTAQDLKTTNVLLRELQWTVAHKLSACFTTLVNLYIRKGSWVEIEWLINEHQVLAEKTNSNNILFHNSLIASDFYRRYGDNEKSREKVDLASSQLPPNVHGLGKICLTVAEVNLAIANGEYGNAMELNEESTSLILNLISNAYLARMESLTAGIMPGEISDKSPLDFQASVPLQKLLNQSLAHRAIIHLKLDQIDAAFEILDALLEKHSDARNVIDSEAELLAIITDAKLLQNQQGLTSAPHSRLLEREVSCLPALKTSRLASIKRSRKDAGLYSEDFTNDLAEVVDDADRALKAWHQMERAALVSTLSFEAGYATFMKSQITKDQTNYGATLSSYYLSLDNAVSMRRDIEACLQVKRNRFTIYRNVKATDKWPSIEYDDEAHFKSINKNMTSEWLENYFEDISRKYRDEYTMDHIMFHEEFIDILPSNWTVCSLSYDPKTDLLFTMQLRAHDTPLIFKLPLNRTKTRPGAKGLHTSFEQATAELKDIIRQSDDTILESQKNIIADPDAIAAWWEKRKKLDGRLKDLLSNMERHWFGGFKGLLSGRCNESPNDLLKFQKEIIDSAYSVVKALGSKPQKKNEYSLELCRVILRLGEQPASSILEDIAYYILSTYDISDNLVHRDLEKLTSKIASHIRNYYQSCSKKQIDPTKNKSGEHVILILDKHLQMLPLESLPVLRSQPASRMPSLSALRDRILYTRAKQTSHATFGSDAWRDYTVAKKNGFYVLNPNGDLRETEGLFAPLLRSIPEWKGVTHTPPSELECISALRTKDVYLYFGHGAGQAFIRGNKVKQLPTCSTSILMGCSSGLLQSNGEFDPYGYVLNYLIAGSPAVVANLWDVTDRSIDRLTYYMLHAWGLLGESSNSKRSLSEALMEGREHSGLTYLIGAAPVVYGIPVYVQEES